MPDNKFDINKISISDFKLLKGQVEASDSFVNENVKNYHSEATIHIGLSLPNKLLKADIIIQITTQSEPPNDEEASGLFHLVYIFKVENLEELATPIENNLTQLDNSLWNSISSISYSTSRGVLITRLQGTALQNFILPVINISELLITTKS